MKNREVYVRDPSASQLPNLGVSRVVGDNDEAFWRTLEWELDSFVCEGSYEKGLDRILSSYLSSLTEDKQPAVWLSGFFGSGKSHLVKVLSHLWVDTELPNHKSARGAASVSAEVEANLAELSTQGKRAGGLWTASGYLSGSTTGSVRLALLSVLFSAAGLPSNYPRASFLLWMEREGIRDQVEEFVEERGKVPSDVYRDLYVSDVLGEALLAVKPEFASSAVAVGDRLEAQFPPVDDISDEDFLTVMEEILRLQSSDGEIPLTLIVLDEMQQFIAEDEERAKHVQDIVEACDVGFKRRVLIVATGQTALAATKVLSKLHDRFPVRVDLEDRDVETVVRQVVLRKKPEAHAALNAALDSVSGEIDRHLDGTRVAATADDKKDLVPDYPILPTRRRFWEKALRAIDKAGKTGVLRSQLRIIHDAASSNASADLGTVVGADFLFEQQAPEMLNSGALLSEVHQAIENLDDGTEAGTLKARICRLVFLISRLESEGINATGVRATAPMIADLLVENLASDGAEIRMEVPELLDELVGAGTLMRIEDEHQLQTSEGAEWSTDFQQRKAEILANPTKMTSLREESLSSVVEKGLTGLSLRHGDSKTVRAVEFGNGNAPPDGGEKIPVWVQNGWEVSRDDFEDQAKAAGQEDPTVFVFVPRIQEEEIREALAAHAAAHATLTQRPMPHTDAGREARKSIETLAEKEDRELGELFGKVFEGIQVFVGGGEEINVQDPRAATELACKKVLARMYPKFQAGDHADWAKVGKKAREGAPDALGLVGFNQPPENHPVCKAVLAAVPATGISGGELRARFKSRPYGWPEDAINGSLLVLLGAGNIRADKSGIPVASVKDVPVSQVGVHTFFQEDGVVRSKERMAVRGLLISAHIPYEAEQEGAAIPALLQHLRELSKLAGGPPPLPESPDSEILDSLKGLAGNQLFRSVAESHDGLAQLLEAWGKAGDLRESRLNAWDRLDRLLRHAQGREGFEEIQTGFDAILDGRQLLDEPDPMAPLEDQLTDMLRDQLNALVQSAQEALEVQLKRLTESLDWEKLSPEKAAEIQSDRGLKPFAKPALADSSQLLKALDEMPLKTWAEQPALCEFRAEQALTIAAQEGAPKSVVIGVPRGSISDEAGMEDLLDGLKTKILKHLNDGETVVIK